MLISMSYLESVELYKRAYNNNLTNHDSVRFNKKVAYFCVMDTPTDTSYSQGTYLFSLTMNLLSVCDQCSPVFFCQNVATLK